MKYLKQFRSFSKIYENSGKTNSEKFIEIVDDVFYDNYVKGDPSKFLNALENVLKEKGYKPPIHPDRPDTFGGSPFNYYGPKRGFEDFQKNLSAIQGLENDRINRPLNRYIMQDILVDKFFNGNQEAAGKAYQEWLLSRGKIRKHHDSAGRDNFLIPKIEDVPIWTPNDDVVDQPFWGFRIDYMFGGKYYTTYQEQDVTKNWEEEYKKNRAEKKYKNVCPGCSSDKHMPWISSAADYPKGMVSKKEICKRCNPKGKPHKMDNWSRGYYCEICKNPDWKEAYVDNTNNIYIKDIEYWKDRLKNDPNNTYVKKELDYFEKKIYKEGQKCGCSFEKLKDLYDRYVEFEDYESLENMKKNRLYDWFFEELRKIQKQPR